MGEFISNRYLCVEATEKGLTLTVYYHALGRRFDLLRVRADGLRGVSWSAGQATSLAGHDMEDWFLGLYFRPEAVLFPSDKSPFYAPEMSGPREQIEHQGQLLIAFLRKWEVSLPEPEAGLLGQVGVICLADYVSGVIAVGDRHYPCCFRSYPVHENAHAVVKEIIGTMLYAEVVPEERSSNPRR